MYTAVFCKLQHHVTKAMSYAIINKYMEHIGQVSIIKETILKLQKGLLFKLKLGLYVS